VLSTRRPEDGGISRRPADRPRFLETLGRALRHRNYRLFFIGQGISLIGTWLTRVATSWLVFRLTGSALLLGVVGFAGQIPTFFLAAFAGVWVDRLDRHRVLVVTQTLAMLQSAALAVLALTGVIRVWHVAALGAFQGFINAFDMPARQSFVVDMVESREDLPNAIALNSSMFNAARLIGPSVAGALITLCGEGWCFATDAVSYLAVIASLLAMRVPPAERRHTGRHVMGDLVDGFRYAFGFAPIRWVLLLLALVSLTGMPYLVLLPVIASTVLHGGAHLYGFMTGASGLGALVGALYLASRPGVLGLGRVIVRAAFLFGAALIVLGVSRTWWISLPVMLITGAGMMVHMASSNTIVQTVVDEDKRGRVMSFYVMAFVGTAPFGSLLYGALAARIGTPMTMIAGGALCMAGALTFRRALPRLGEIIRPVYARLGILPSIAEGLDSATQLMVPPEK
jgi:MFS family permease